jgi:hypothetical protein
VLSSIYKPRLDRCTPWNEAADPRWHNLERSKSQLIRRFLGVNLICTDIPRRLDEDKLKLAIRDIAIGAPRQRCNRTNQDRFDDPSATRNLDA